MGGIRWINGTYYKENIDTELLNINYKGIKKDYK